MTSIAPPSIVFEDRRWSSRDLTAIAAGWWSSLVERGVGSAGAVAMVMANHPDAVALFFAVSSLPTPVILLPPDAGAWRSSSAFPRGTPLCLPPRLAHLERRAESAGFRPTVLPEAATADAPDAAAFLSCPGLVTFTSGSTGAPRPVYRRTTAFIGAARAFVAAFDIPARGGVVGTLPLAYTHGLGQNLLTAAVLGGTLGLVERFDHRSTLALFASGRYHFWAGTPVMTDILSRCPLPAPMPAPGVCAVGGGAVSETVFRAFRERFGVSLRRTYGTTELGHLSADTSPVSGIRLETVGRPYADVQVRIGDDPRDPLPPSGAGTVWIKTPWGMDGYGFPPELDPSPVVDGWSATTDVGVLDEAGYLTLLGRRDDAVKLGTGHLVNLTEVTAALASGPRVSAVAVCPLDTEGGRVLAALVEGDTPDVREVQRHAAQILPPWARPWIVRVAAALPRLPGGKIDRRACAAILEQAAAPP